MTGEGLWTTFRELKPGTADAIFDGLAPLRWCLFAEPVNVYRGTPVRLEACLANEDVLRPGQYPVQLPGGRARRDPRLATNAHGDDPRNQGQERAAPGAAGVRSTVVIDGPAGKYRFSATFQRGAAAAGEIVEFYVADPAPTARDRCRSGRLG